MKEVNKIRCDAILFSRCKPFFLLQAELDNDRFSNLTPLTDCVKFKNALTLVGRRSTQLAFWLHRLSMASQL